jgi:hypothetical protein
MALMQGAQGFILPVSIPVVLNDHTFDAFGALKCQAQIFTSKTKPQRSREEFQSHADLIPKEQVINGNK